jgi:prevent-host-death family protein
MIKKVSATDAKNNFGGLLEDVTTLGRVDIVRHGRLVAVLLSPGQMRSLAGNSTAEANESNHMIPAKLARAARRVGVPFGFDED